MRGSFCKARPAASPRPMAWAGAMQPRNRAATAAREEFFFMRGLLGVSRTSYGHSKRRLCSVILSAAKDLVSAQGQILRCAQDDKYLFRCGFRGGAHSHKETAARRR